MPAYVAFLRAINLGASRKFGKDAVAAATEAAGGTEVATYLNTGNVRLRHGARSPARVQAALEQAYADAAGFEVPCVVFTTADLAALVETGEKLHAEYAPAGKHYVSLFATPPGADAVRAVEALGTEGQRCVVQGRAAYALLDGNIHDSKLLDSREFAALGRGTARTIDVLRTVRDRWCAE